MNTGIDNKQIIGAEHLGVRIDDATDFRCAYEMSSGGEVIGDIIFSRRGGVSDRESRGWV